MSSDPSAVLFYGYKWEAPQDLFGSDEWDTALWRSRGGTDPYLSYVEPSLPCTRSEREYHFREWHMDHGVEIEQYYAEKKTIKAEFGVDLGQYGTDGYMVPYLYFDEGMVQSDWSRDVSNFIWSGSPTPQPNRNYNSFDKWFKALGIEKPHSEPRWFLVVSYF